MNQNRRDGVEEAESVLSIVPQGAPCKEEE